MKNAFNQHNRAEKFRAESILAQKLTRLRIALASRIQDPEAAFGGKEYHAFINNIRKTLRNPAAFEQELKKATVALEKKESPQDPDISSPEHQLLWAAVLLFIDRQKPRMSYYDPSASPYGYPLYGLKRELTETKLWQQLQDTSHAKQALISHGVYINEELRRTDTRFAWGEPRSGVKYEVKSNTIHVDFLMGLVAGLEHTHSAMFREIGKSQLSTVFPEQNRQIRDRIMVLKDKEDAGRKLSNDEYKELRLLALEWEMRRMLWEAAEKNVTNRFTAFKGQEKAQEYAYSLNHFLMTSSAFGAAALGDLRERQGGEDPVKAMARETREELNKQVQDLLNSSDGKVPEDMLEMLREQMAQLDAIMADENTPEHRFMNILKVIELSFFKNNGLFDHDRESWEMFGVRPDDIRISKKKQRPISNDNRPYGSFPSADFQYLIDLCGGENGLESLLPRSRDRWYGKSYFNSLTDSHAYKRNEIIEKIWDLYIQDIADELARNLEEQLNEELGNEKGKDGQDQDGQDQDSDEQDGQGQDGDGEPGDGQGESQDGQGQPGEGQPGEGQPGQGQPGQGQPGQGGQPSDQQGGQQSGEPQKGGSPKDFGTDEKPFGENDGEQQAPQEEFDASTAGTNDDRVDVKNEKGETKYMPDVDVPPEHPEGQEPGQDATGQGQDQNKEGAEGKTLEDIQKEIEEALKEAQEESEAQQGQDGEGGEPGDGEPQQGGEGEGDASSNAAGDGGTPKTLEDIASMEWKSYSSLMVQLKGYVNKTSRVLEKIRDIQLEKTIKRSRDLEMLPEGKEMDRLDPEAHQNLIVKKNTGQGLEKDDLNRFQKDETHQKPTTIDIVLLIDGSGSMTMDFGKLGKATAMEIALLSSIILYEAAKEVDANVYIGLWGNDAPIMLAKPGDDPRDVENNIMKAKKGLNCGTSLAPSIKKITKVLSEHKSSQYSGYTHMMVISDGDISDPAPAIKAMNTLLSTSEYTTMEFAILKGKGGGYYPNPYQNSQKTAMERVAEKVRVGNPTQKIGIHRDSDPNSIPAGIVGLIFQKIRTMKSFAAVPWAKKRKQFQAADRKFDMK